MRRLIFKLGVALLAFVVGLAAYVGWRLLRRTSKPVVVTGEFRINNEDGYGTIMWQVEEAKAKGETEYETGFIACGMAVPSLRVALDNYSLVVAEPVDKRTYADSFNLITWYRFRIIERLSNRPASEQLKSQLRYFSPPKDIQLGADEILIPEAGGTMVIDGVTVRDTGNVPEYDLSKKYLLFLDMDADKRVGSIPWSDAVGIFTVNDGDRIAAAYRDGEYDLKERMKKQFGNSLARLRESVARLTATRRKL